MGLNSVFFPSIIITDGSERKHDYYCHIYSFDRCYGTIIWWNDSIRSFPSKYNSVINTSGLGKVLLQAFSQILNTPHILVAIHIQENGGSPVSEVAKAKRNSGCFKKAVAQSTAQLFETPWTVARQAPLSMGSPARILEWVATSFSEKKAVSWAAFFFQEGGSDQGKGHAIQRPH